MHMIIKRNVCLIGLDLYIQRQLGVIRTFYRLHSTQITKHTYIFNFKSNAHDDHLYSLIGNWLENELLSANGFQSPTSEGFIMSEFSLNNN